MRSGVRAGLLERVDDARRRLGLKADDGDGAIARPGQIELAFLGQGSADNEAPGEGAGLGRGPREGRRDEAV